MVPLHTKKSHSQQKDYQNQCTTFKNQIHQRLNSKIFTKSILLHDLSDFIEVFDFSDGFTIQSLSDYLQHDFGPNFLVIPQGEIL